MKSGGRKREVWFLFAPGAGAPSDSAWMSHHAENLSKIGPVERFDYPYMLAGKKRPDSHHALLEAHREALVRGRQKHGSRIVLVGKSMGSRISCHLALEEEVLGVVCLGYPLKGMSVSAPLRDQVLLQLNRPALFVQGTRDRLCPLELLEPVLEKRAAASRLHVVPTGDHSLLATKTYLKQEGTTQEQLDQKVLEAIQEFVDEVT